MHDAQLQGLTRELSNDDLADASTQDAEVATLLGEQAPDLLATALVHVPPLLLRFMYKQLPLVWTRVRGLQHFLESWEDWEQSDLGLLMLRMQLVRDVFGESCLESEELCKGLALGKLCIPTDDYNIYKVEQQLTAASFKECCLKHATSDSRRAFLGPGNWGPDGWLILWRPDGQLVVLFVQSKLRSDIVRKYTGSALKKEASKCWEVEGAVSCLLYLTDERGRGEDNEALDVGASAKVVPVSRDARLATYGVALETLKRCWEIVSQKERTKKPKK